MVRVVSSAYLDVGDGGDIYGDWPMGDEQAKVKVSKPKPISKAKQRKIKTQRQRLQQLRKELDKRRSSRS